jgi:hypothetical protein
MAAFRDEVPDRKRLRSGPEASRTASTPGLVPSTGMCRLLPLRRPEPHHFARGFKQVTAEVEMGPPRSSQICAPRVQDW